MENPISVNEVKVNADSIRGLIERSRNNRELNFARRHTRRLIRSGTAKHLDSSIRKASRIEGKSLNKEIKRRSKEIS